MQYLNDKGFVLRRINFGESDRFITLFTENSGKVEVIAKGVRKITSRRASSVEPLNLIEFQAVKSSKNFILTEVKLLDSFEGLKYKLLDMQKVFLMCELVHTLSAYDQKHYEVFKLMHDTLCKIQEDESDEYLNSFQTELLFLLGFWDKKNDFRDEVQLTRFIENIIEKKIKTKSYFKI